MFGLNGHLGGLRLKRGDLGAVSRYLGGAFLLRLRTAVSIMEWMK
jgi:hypothetical protein